MKKQYRQGDLLFIEASGAPKGTKKHSLKILESSITGHSHQISEGEIYVNEPTWSDNANFYVVVPNGADLIHGEHETINLPAGIYQVVRQKEVTGYVKD